MRPGFILLLACFLFSPAQAQKRGGQLHPLRAEIVRRLTFIVKTGNDDLRGGEDNLNVAINFRDGNVQVKPNVNRGQRWPDNTTQTFDIGLERPGPVSEIASIDLKKPSDSVSFGTDEWHMESVSVRATGDHIDKIIAAHGFMSFNWFDSRLRMLITTPEAGKANKLEFTFKTGGDNLESGDRLAVTIHYRDGSTQEVRDFSGGKEWANGSTHVRIFTLDHNADPADIIKIVLQAGYSLSSWPSGDNWDMESLSVRAIGEGVDTTIVRHGFNRFTGTNRSLSIPITPPQPGRANKLELIVQTGGDDLRGDNDNLNVIIHFHGGRIQTARNINGGKAWKNNSMHVETVTLDQAVNPADIVGVELQTTFTGGTGGDNWNMNSVIVKAIGDGVDEVLFRNGFKRFTGDNKTLRLRSEQ